MMYKTITIKEAELKAILRLLSGLLTAITNPSVKLSNSESISIPAMKSFIERQLLLVNPEMYVIINYICKVNDIGILTYLTAQYRYALTYDISIYQ